MQKCCLEGGRKESKRGDFCVTLAFEILTYAKYAAVSKTAQALKSPPLSTFGRVYKP